MIIIYLLFQVAVLVSITVCASHSQSDMGYNEYSRNHQCACMSLTFLAYENKGCHFDTAVLDRVLEKVNSLYVGVKEQLREEESYWSDLLTVEESGFSHSKSRIHFTFP